MTRKYTLGIDIGSRYTKLVQRDNDLKAVACYKIVPSGIEPLKTVESLLGEMRGKWQAEDLAFEQIPAYSTGYGRKLLNTPYVSEINCHAKAVFEIIPGTSLVIDIGGQDSKVIQLDKNGKVIGFSMNDKCAAGTGSFFERIADLCNVSTAEIGDLALLSKEELNISSTCVVFAESEIISLINKNRKIADILMAVHKAVAFRIENMLPDKSRLTDGRVVLTGGVANNKALISLLEKIIGVKISVPPIPAITGAIGAAIFAAEQL